MLLLCVLMGKSVIVDGVCVDGVCVDVLCYVLRFVVGVLLGERVLIFYMICV